MSTPPVRSWSIESLEGLLVEGQQDVDDVAPGAQSALRKADLVEAVTALDLGWWDGVGQNVVAGAGGCLRHHLAGDQDAFACFAGNSNDEVFTSHDAQSLRSYHATQGPPSAHGGANQAGLAR